MLEPDTQEVAEGFKHEALQGWTAALASEEETREAFEKAFSYRGDVTLTRTNGSTLECYVFDRRTGPTLQDSIVRVIPTGTREKLSIPYSEIAGLAFTGRDTAAGKGWEAWVRKYWEKKALGQQGIGIEAEGLD